LYDLKDLPYDDSLEDMPNGFTAFRNKVEKNCSVRGPLPIPKDLNTISNNQDVTSMIDQYSIELPSLQDLGYTLDQIDHANFQDARGVMTFRGGETAGLARVKEYIWDKDLLKTYFDSRNGMLGSDYSSKLSPWLAHGNISPRYLARECKKYEETRVANKSTYCKNNCLLIQNDSVAVFL
jgi:deoxyribodipyrimidine photo-lyase